MANEGSAQLLTMGAPRVRAVIPFRLNISGGKSYPRRMT